MKNLLTYLVFLMITSVAGQTGTSAGLISASGGLSYEKRYLDQERENYVSDLSISPSGGYFISEHLQILARIDYNRSYTKRSDYNNRTYSIINYGLGGRLFFPTRTAHWYGGGHLTTGKLIGSGFPKVTFEVQAGALKFITDMFALDMGIRAVIFFRNW